MTTIDPNGQPCTGCNTTRRTYSVQKRAATIGCTLCKRKQSCDLAAGAFRELQTVEQVRAFWTNFHA